MLTACAPPDEPPSTKASSTPSPTLTTAPQATDPADWAGIQNDLVILYWYAGDLWRATADGSSREQLTQGRLFDAWFPTELIDPWWIGGPPPLAYISPDGRWLAAPLDGRQAVIVDLSGVEPSRWLPAIARSFAWSPDSQYIAYGLNKVDVYDVTTGEILEGPKRGPGDLEDIVWSADGLEIAYACCFRPDEEQPGREIGRIRRHNLSTDESESAGETWRSLGSGTPGLCWSGGRPVPADETTSRDHCSPRDLVPRADSPDGTWRAELTDYSPEVGGFRQVAVTEAAGEAERLRLDLPGRDPPLDLKRIFWTPDGEALLLGSDRPGTAIYRLALYEDPYEQSFGNGSELESILSDGILVGVIPQWSLPRPGNEAS